LRPINHHPQTGKPPSHSATPDFLTCFQPKFRNLDSFSSFVLDE
jgi:hypothetical protein